MNRIISTYAEAELISCRKEVHTEYMHSVSNEGQSCITLTPRWSEYGRALEDGTVLQAGKTYKITIEVVE